MDNIAMLNLDIAADSGEERYVIFNLAGGTFAVSCKYVVSIESPAKITEIANAPEGVRGVGYYKNEALNIFDLRIIFGYPPHEYHVENEINIAGHIEEHEKWAAEIRENLETSSELTFAPDPLKCGLGKWLESYKTNNMNTANLIKRIKPIHEQFHKLADRTGDFRSKNQAETEKFLSETESVKAELTRNLNELHNMLLNQAKELTIVLKIKEQKIGIIIDNAESVETMEEIQKLPPVALATEYIKNLGFRKKDKLITLIIDAEVFV